MINIKTDSRRVKQGDIFVALRGIKNDGHSFIPTAIKNGASKIIAEYGEYDIDYEIVEDTREYLKNYLVDNYNKYLNEMTIIGLTGTNGKTTIAYLLYQALNKLNRKCAYIGTIGFYLDEKVCSLANTTPDVCELYEYIIEAYDKGYRYITLEASSSGLHFKRLEGILFDYAIFTNLTHEHLDIHNTMEEYALTKQKLFKKLKPNGKAIVNIDDNYKNYYLLEENTNITYGTKTCDYQITDYHFDSNGTQFSFKKDNKIYELSTSLIGEYNIYNMLPVIITLEDLGITYDNYVNVISSLTEPKGRMEIIKYKDNNIIVDYAHTDDGMEKLITTVKKVTEGKIIVVFGERGNRDRTKRPNMMKVAQKLSDYVIVTKNHCYHEDPNQIIDDLLKGVINDNYEVIMDRDKAILKGISLLEHNDALLILGKGHEDYLDFGNERIHFDDKEFVIETINKDLVLN